jgi:multidrug efflux pump subunit AcrA (membrane-fusion protein)
VTQLQGGYQIALVGSDNKINIRAVKAGEKIGQMWVIEEGLKPGEQVVVQGQDKVREGSLVAVKPADLTAKAANPAQEGQ